MEPVKSKRCLRSEVQEAKITSTMYNSGEYFTTPVGNGSVNSSFKYDEKSEKELLEERGIRIEYSNVKNFANVSPIQVAEFYKGLGEWQNVLPKTDYTYSPMSDYYRKKINGQIPIIPNMSRRDIWKRRLNWNSVEVADNVINSYHAAKYSSSSMSKVKQWFSFSDENTPQKISLSKYLSYTSTTNRRRRRSISTGKSYRESPSLDLGLNVHVQKIRRNISQKIVSLSSTLFSSSTNTWSPLQYLLLFMFSLVAYLLLSSTCNSFSGSNRSVYSTLSGKVESILELVSNIFNLTFSSKSFPFPLISWPGNALNIACNVLLTPLYEFGILLTSWKDYKSTTESRGKSLYKAEAEELIRNLFDGFSSEFMQKFINSPEFASFVDDKLKKFDYKNNEQYEKLIYDYGNQNLLFKEMLGRLKSLASKMELPGRIQTLRIEVRRLREEIESIEKRAENNVIVLLSAAFETEQGNDTSFAELKNKFIAVFHSIEVTHHKIDKLNFEFFKYVNNATENIDIAMQYSKESIKFDLKSFVEELVSRKMGEWRETIRSSVSNGGSEIRFEQLERYVRNVVQKALEIYDADKTGKPDFALESSGGIILSTRCTETKTANAQFSILGIPLWQTFRTPRTVIQPGVHPGECWAFPGSVGYLVIQLSERILVTGVTMEHIPRSLAANGTIDSAPKDFSVWALRDEADLEPRLLGSFQFKVDGPSLQYFETIRLNKPYQIVELKILSNHGKVDYTCVYRFRVHGIP